MAKDLIKYKYCKGCDKYKFKTEKYFRFVNQKEFNHTLGIFKIYKVCSVVCLKCLPAHTAKIRKKHNDKLKLTK